MSEQIPEFPAQAETSGNAVLHQWFMEQRIKSVDNLEAGATHLITLTLALLTVLIGIMGLSDGNIPLYMKKWAGLQWLSGIGIVALLISLLCALGVVWPLPYEASIGKPNEIEAAFETLLERKATLGRAAMGWFGAGVVCLGLTVVVALLWEI
ncbi:MAG: hypothetical protein ACPG8W_23685 [Candidatus Promineifilaceae bacterium]